MPGRRAGQVRFLATVLPITVATTKVMTATTTKKMSPTPMAAPTPVPVRDGDDRIDHAGYDAGNESTAHVRIHESSIGSGP